MKGSKGSKFWRLGSFPASFPALVVPGVDVLAAAYAVADEFRVAIVAEFKVSYYPSCSRVHVGFQLHQLLRQALCQRIERIVGALVTPVGAWVGFHGVERSIGPVDSVVIVAEGCA